MKKLLTLLITIIIFMLIHEGTHGLVALLFDEYKTFKVNWYGPEVIFKTPVFERSGIKWGLISGISNLLTLAVGYTAFIKRKQIAGLGNSYFRLIGYWFIFVFLLFDPVNLSILPFIFNGDVGGIAEGFGIDRYLVQGIFFSVLFLNRELIVRKVFPVFGVKTDHPLFQPLPWL